MTTRSGPCLSQRERLFNASFPETPSFPIAPRPNRADDVGAFAPDLKIGAAHTWTVGFQRSITRDMAIEARYVGTYGMNQRSTLDYNSMRTENLLKNGFLDEFRLAMDNLRVNNAAGGTRAGSFAYFGPNSGTHPLPISPVSERSHGCDQSGSVYGCRRSCVDGSDVDEHDVRGAAGAVEP